MLKKNMNFIKLVDRLEPAWSWLETYLALTCSWIYLQGLVKLTHVYMVFFLLLLRGNLDKAIDMFNKAINLAKSEMEMAHLYSLCDAAYAQTEVARKYGLKPPTL